MDRPNPVPLPTSLVEKKGSTALASVSWSIPVPVWGADSNLFHQGAAKESDDPAVIAATMAKPGIVLKRPVGSNGPFGEHAGLPTDHGRGEKPSGATRKSPARKPKAARPSDTAADRNAALAYEREAKLRARERAKQDAAEKREKERREAAIEKAQSDLDTAEREHAEKAAAFDAEREAVEKKSRNEDARWEKERDRLRAALKRARELTAFIAQAADRTDPCAPDEARPCTGPSRSSPRPSPSSTSCARRTGARMRRRFSGADRISCASSAWLVRRAIAGPWAARRPARPRAAGSGSQRRRS